MWGRPSEGPAEPGLQGNTARFGCCDTAQHRRCACGGPVLPAPWTRARVWPPFCFCEMWVWVHASPRPPWGHCRFLWSRDVGNWIQPPALCMTDCMEDRAPIRLNGTFPSPAGVAAALTPRSHDPRGGGDTGVDTPRAARCLEIPPLPLSAVHGAWG